MKWMSVSSKVTSETLELRDCDINTCIFGVSVETAAGSSGLHWSTIYDRRKGQSDHLMYSLYTR